MRFKDALKGTTLGILFGISDGIKFSLGYIADIILLALPYVMFYLGKNFSDHLILFMAIPPIVLIIWYYLKEISNRINHGGKFPIPEARFTKVDEYGEVSVERSRLQEMILYVGDVEDWLHRKGLM